MYHLSFYNAATDPFLQPLKEADPRVVLIPSSGYTWSTYTELEAQGLLNDVVTKSWEEEREWASSNVFLFSRTEHL